MGRRRKNEGLRAGAVRGKDAPVAVSGGILADGCRSGTERPRTRKGVLKRPRLSFSASRRPSTATTTEEPFRHASSRPTSRSGSASSACRTPPNPIARRGGGAARLFAFESEPHVGDASKAFRRRAFRAVRPLHAPDEKHAGAGAQDRADSRCVRRAFGRGLLLAATLGAHLQHRGP